MSKSLIGIVALAGIFDPDCLASRKLWFTENQNARSQLMQLAQICKNNGEQYQVYPQPTSDTISKPFRLACTTISSEKCSSAITRQGKQAVELINLDWANERYADRLKIVKSRENACLVWYVPVEGSSTDPIQYAPGP